MLQPWQETYSYKSRKDLCKNSENIGRKELGNCFKSSFSKWEISRKDTILAGDFNINLIDFDGNKKLQIFVNLVFCFGMVLVNKPMRVTEQTGSAIGHFIANSITQTGFKSGIIKTGISDHFPFLFVVVSILPKSQMLRWNLYINSNSPISQ